MVPVPEPGHHRHGVGLEHVETGGEDIRHLPLVDKNRRLPRAYRQLGTLVDLMPRAVEAPDHGVACVIRPVDAVDEFLAQRVEDAHVVLSKLCFELSGLRPCAILDCRLRVGRLFEVIANHQGEMS